MNNFISSLSGITALVTNEVIDKTPSISNEDNIFLLFFILPLLIFILIFIIAGYIYTSIAYYKIAKKIKTGPAGLAWIPIANYYLFAKMAKMHWWPILFLIPLFLAGLFIIISKILFIIFLIIGIFCLIPLAVYWYIWHYKFYERAGKPGWYILLTLVPSAGGILYLIFLGIVAWGKD